MPATEQGKSIKQESPGSESDEEYLYGTFLGSLKTKQDLQNRAIDSLVSRERTLDMNYRKFRNLPADDDMNIDASQRTTINHNGPGWLKSAALAALVGSAGVVGFLIANTPEVPTRAQTVERLQREFVDTNTHHQLRIVDPD